MGITKRNVSKLIAAYRRLVFWFGIQILIAIIGAFANFITGDTMLGFVITFARTICIVVTLVALAVYAYRTAVALELHVASLWAAAMFIPLLNAVILLVLSTKATNACRQAGIPVGFFGPRFKAKITLSRRKKKK
jgi:uncharacterized membrane protein